MSDFSPYQTPAAGDLQAPVPLGPESIKPQVITMFGVIHLIMAGLGVLAVGMTVFSMVFTNRFMGALDPGNPMVEIQNRLAWVNFLSAAFMAVLAVMLVIAGVALLRGRRNSLRLSNIYAYASIATKLVSVVLALAVVAPLTRQMMEASMPPELGPGANSFISGISTFSGVLGPVISCTYPVLAIVLLNRPHVKTWLASFGR